MSRVIDSIEIHDESDGLIVRGKQINGGVIPATAGRFCLGAEIIGSNGITYKNTGTTASPVWSDEESIVSGNMSVAGNTILGTSSSNSLVVNAKFTGQLYTNETGSAATKLKIHNHSTTASIGSMEAKGEFVNDTGTLYGTYTNYDYTPTSASVAPTDVEGSLSNITLTAGKTMTAGNLVGFTGQAINSGVLDGAAILQAGVIGSVAGAGLTTQVSHIAGVCSSVGSDVVNPTAGELSSYIATNLGTVVVDNLVKVVGNATTTNVFNFADATGCVAGGVVRTATADDVAVDSAGSLIIKIGANTYKIPYFA
jgi:hypothetical protein